MASEIQFVPRLDRVGPVSAARRAAENVGLGSLPRDRRSRAIGAGPKPGPTVQSSPPPSQWRASRSRLIDLHHRSILMQMRTTLNLDDELIDRARRLTGIREKTALLHAGLEALIARASSHRLAALGGTERRLAAIPRRRLTKTG